jgi:hypothetical protein
MKGFKTISAGLLLLLAAYCGSYIVLRCAGMRFGPHRSDVNGVSRITTYVNFGNGDNGRTRVARAMYLPMHRAEYAWLCWSGAVFVYD